MSYNEQITHYNLHVCRHKLSKQKSDYHIVVSYEPQFNQIKKTAVNSLFVTFFNKTKILYDVILGINQLIIKR